VFQSFILHSRCGPHAIWTRLQSDQRGVTALEYALMAGLVVMAVAAASPMISNMYTSSFNRLVTVATAALSH
jgi:Flp pilus assembly pilin Flp